MHPTVFDALFDRGSADVLARRHREDEPPGDGGRWPVSVVCVPEPAVRRRLERWMARAVELAGPGHFLTGRADASHVTVRALETYREAARPDEPDARAWASAMRSAAAVTPPLRLELTGVTLTSGSVMVQLEPVDDAPWVFMETLRSELGSHAWFEDRGAPRDIWYANVLHLAAPVADPEGLVAWVGAHRSVPREPVVLDTVSLVRYRYRETASGRVMAMEEWDTTPLAGG